MAAIDQTPRKGVSGQYNQETELNEAGALRLRLARQQVAAENTIEGMTAALDALKERGVMTPEDLDGRVTPMTAKALREAAEAGQEPAPDYLVVSDAEWEAARSEYDLHMDALRAILREQRRTYTQATAQIGVLDLRYGETELKARQLTAEAAEKRQQERAEAQADKAGAPSLDDTLTPRARPAR